jgi:hypothetical protein
VLWTSMLYIVILKKNPIPYPNKIGKGLNKGIGYPPTGTMPLNDEFLKYFMESVFLMRQ